MPSQIKRNINLIFASGRNMVRLFRSSSTSGSSASNVDSRIIQGDLSNQGIGHTNKNSLITSNRHMAGNDNVILKDVSRRAKQLGPPSTGRSSSSGSQSFDLADGISSLSISLTDVDRRSRRQTMESTDRQADLRRSAHGRVSKGPATAATAATSTATAMASSHRVSLAGTTSTTNTAASGVTNLIVLIEQSQWQAASVRALSHSHEVKQLVKLRKTTSTMVKNTPQSGQSQENLRGNALQISNVKCKALHHACQKLRSVHTNFYSSGETDVSQWRQLRKVEKENGEYETEEDSTAVDAVAAAGVGAASIIKRQVIDKDEFIEACKCILTLVQIHPEACKERESRHGCLPLHLAVFSMCGTPSPPIPHNTGGSATVTAATRVTIAAASRKNSDKPPTICNRSISAPTVKETLAQRISSQPFPISATEVGLTNSNSARKQHRITDSNSSADFSVGNMSTMMQQESQHQQELDDHRQWLLHEEGHHSSNTNTAIEDKLLERMENMDMILRDLEKELSNNNKKKNFRHAQEKNPRGSSNGAVSPSAVGMCSEDSVAAVVAGAITSSSNHDESTTATTIATGKTKVAGLCIPMDSLDEISKETDQSPALPNLQLVEHRSPASSPPPPPPILTSSSSSSLTSSLGNWGKSISRKLLSNPTSSKNSTDVLNPRTTNQNCTHEELTRRYLQINSQRREEYSLRVINALIDAWPRGVKTASEGGRLPLHMACFGRATVKVMETILHAYPDAARQRNADGFLPIHIAAHWGVSHPDIAPMLLRAYPDGAVGRNRWERTPIEEALGMAGENGREHQLALVWALRRHPTYWIHNDIGMMLQPRNVRSAPWRMLDTGDSLRGSVSLVERGGGGAVDVDEVGSSDDESESEGFEVKLPRSGSITNPNFIPNPKHTLALAKCTELSLLITKYKHWDSATLRCQSNPEEARETLEIKVRGAYTAKITPLHYACEQNPTIDVVRALVKADPSALRRRQEPGGQLPIHAACTWGASAEAIHVLLEACPASVKECDFLSNLPLHCACYSGSETEVVESLLRIFPQSVWLRNHQGSSPVDIVKRLGHTNRKEVLLLLEGTMNEMLASKLSHGEDASNPRNEEEGVEVNGDNGLMWV